MSESWKLLQTLGYSYWDLEKSYGHSISLYYVNGRFFIEIEDGNENVVYADETIEKERFARIEIDQDEVKELHRILGIYLETGDLPKE